MDTKQTDFLAKTIFEQYSANAGIFTPPEDDNSYGIEIEMEGVGDDGLHTFGNNAKKNPAWRVVADGSLRNGVEFVSNGPRAFNVLPDDLDQLSAYLASVKFTPVFSYRTSVHVHCNVQQLSVAEVMALFCLYTIFEAPMIQFGGEERCGNVHCLPVSMAQNVLDRARAVCYNVDPVEAAMRPGAMGWHQSWRYLTSNDYRYASFNWASLPNYGTVEFRSHRGTADKTEIMNWVSIIHSLKQAALILGNPTNVVNDLSQLGIRQFTDNIFGEFAPEFAKFCEPYDQAIWEGVRLAQFVGYSRKEWPEKKVFKAKDKRSKAETAAPAQEFFEAPQWAANNVQLGGVVNRWIAGDLNDEERAERQRFREMQQLEMQQLMDMARPVRAQPNVGAAARRRAPRNPIILDEFN